MPHALAFDDIRIDRVVEGQAVLVGEADERVLVMSQDDVPEAVEGAVLVGADFSGSGLVVGGEDSSVPPLPPLPPELRKPVNR